MDEIFDDTISNNLEVIYSRTITIYMNFISYLKFKKSDEIKKYFEDNNDLTKLHKFYFKYQIHFIHYLFMNPNLSIELIDYFLNKGFNLTYSEETRLILYYLLLNNFLDIENALKILQFLKNKSYDFSLKDINNCNVYHYLAELNLWDENLCDLLYSYTKDIDAVNEDGNTPVLLSCQKNNFILTDFFLKLNCDVTITNNNNNNCLMYACMNNNYSLVKKLLVKGIDVNFCDNQGDIPFFYACGCDNLSNLNINIIKLLYENNTNINSRSNDNFTALHYAAGALNNSCNLDVIKYLLTLDIDTSIIDNFNKTYLDYVLDNQNDKNVLCDFIKDIKLDINLKNSLILKFNKLNLELDLLKENKININETDLIYINFIKNSNIIKYNYEKNINNEICNICHDNLVLNDESIKCKNNHYYHRNCINKWFDTPKRYNCPLCYDKINLSEIYVFK